jgi:hypothetical protein
MKAFHNDPAIKQKYIDRVKHHRQMDDIIKGQYGNKPNGRSGWRGCAVGCTIHGNAHDKYETELGIPISIARLEDGIFEGLPEADFKEFPLAFLEAIPVGADLSMVTSQFLLWLLIDPQDGVIKFTEAGSAQYVSIENVGNLFKRRLGGNEPTEQEWHTAYAAADAYAGHDAAYAAAYAAYAAYTAADAAYTAADAAYTAAAADAYAAAYTADAAAAAAAAYTADAAAGHDAGHARQKQRDKLQQLLANAPLTEGNE